MRAGRKPNTTPTSVEQAKAPASDSIEIFILKLSDTLLKAADASSASDAPIAPPTRQIITASIRNCCRMSLWRAPTAMRTPISRVRSVTDTSMMFITPMPPTSSEISAIDEISIVITCVVASMVLRMSSLLLVKKSLLPWRRVSVRVSTSSATSIGASSRMRTVMPDRWLRPSMRPIAVV